MLYDDNEEAPLAPVHTEFPRWKYHKNEQPVMVANEDEAQFLEDEFPGEWKNSPKDHDIITAPSILQDDTRNSNSFAQLKAIQERKKAAEKHDHKKHGSK